LAVPAEAAPVRDNFVARLAGMPWARRMFIFGVGALLTLGFAPLQWWPLAVICPAALIYLWEGASPREAAALGFWFNFGTFVAGVYWIYTGVHIMAGVPAWIALFLMFGLAGIMAAYHALLGYFVARWLPAGGGMRWLVALPAAWLFIEWWRGWFLSGFAWLSLGYSQTDTWLANLAPIVGVYGLSAVLLVSAGALVALVKGNRGVRIASVTVLVVPWIAGYALQGTEWTHVSGKPVSVAILQGAIPQDQKLADEKSEHTAESKTLTIYRELAESAFGTQLIVFPEASLPPIANEIVDYLRELFTDAAKKNSSLVIGILRAEGDNGQGAYKDYYNSVLALDRNVRAVQWYDKHHLVPYTEVFPVPGLVRTLMGLMDLGYADFTRGPAVQPPLRAAGLALSASICYEDGYGSSQLPVLAHADTLVNVTNDAWFGHGSARYLHFQIARMRAIEAQRYMIRAGNDGISAVIGPRGEIVAEAPGFVRHVLRSEVTPRMGLPPYAHVGNWLIVSLSTVGVLLGIWLARRGRRKQPG
jgi:apolipoprotein N-acyltransferase